MTAGTAPASVALDPSTILTDLEGGRVRAAEPDPTSFDGWSDPARGQDRDPRLLRGPRRARLDGGSFDLP